MSLAGLFADGDARPLNPDLPAATDWPVAALVLLLSLSTLAWLSVRPRLAPHGPVPAEDRLAGHLAALLVLGLVALVVAATNPYSLIFVLPSLHAWLWLPHLRRTQYLGRALLFAAGFLGPLILLGSFALRLELGPDALAYLVSLVSVGYVTPALVVAALVWAAAACQVGAVAFGRYRPYPPREERPERGPVRETIRWAALHLRRRRAAAPEAAEDERPALRVVDDG
jgi:hypothetical protein